MRTLHTDKIIEAVKEMCISANLYLADDMDGKIRQAAKEEDSTLGKQILNQLIENMEIAGEDKIPICQDTGMAVFFVNVGQDLHIEGMNLTDAINEGVRRGYTEGYLRKSVVRDPLLRENTGDNTPAIIHYDIVPGDQHSEKAHIAKLEDEILELVNKTGIGPGGLGGKTTALAVNIETYATHIAGMPLAVNMCCHVNRHKTVVL